MNTRNTRDTAAILRAGLRDIKPPFTTVIVFSFFLNLLLFVSPLYMLQIYDRVISSRSEITLWAITGIALFLLVVYGALEGLRARILVRCGNIFNARVATPVFNAIQATNIHRPGAANAQSLKDVDTIRDFFAGTGLVTLADLPWFPVFVLGAFILHPWFGYIAIFGGIVVLALTLANARLTQKPLQEASEAGLRANQSAQAIFANAAVLQAMSMLAPLRARWMARHNHFLNLQIIASDCSGAFLAATKAFRLILQAAILGTGAYLVIHQELSAGSMIAASVLIGRALQPVEQAVGNWKGIVAARTAWDRLRRLLQSAPVNNNSVALPAPEGALLVEGVVVAAPETGRIILRGASFTAQSGEAIALIGASGSGKSTLARAIVGAMPLHSGKIRLDGHDIQHWPDGALGRHLGYLPQDVELFPGTVAENISRFSDSISEAILEAADMAGCASLIQSLPDGFNTQIGTGGHLLSGGQRQRIGLARALFGNPSLVVLDEPDASLDDEGIFALRDALRHLKERKVTTLMVTHRAAMLEAADRILKIENGAIAPTTPRRAAPPARPSLLQADTGPGRQRVFGGISLGGHPLSPRPSITRDGSAQTPLGAAAKATS